MLLGTVTLPVIALVFMFAARTRFLVQHSIVNVSQKLYERNLVKDVREFAKYDFKYQKTILDLDFLIEMYREKYHTDVFKIQGCQQTNTCNIITYLYSNTYNICLKRSLNQEISIKHKLIRGTKAEFNIMTFYIMNVLHHETCFFYFVHVTTIFLDSNDKAISKIQTFHGKKLHNLFFNNCYDNFVTSHGADKVIFNFSTRVLTDHKKSLLIHYTP